MTSFAARTALFAAASTLAVGCASAHDESSSESTPEPLAAWGDSSSADPAADLASEVPDTSTGGRTYHWVGIEDDVLVNHDGIYIKIRVAMQVAYDYRYAHYARAYAALTCKLNGKPHDCVLFASKLQLNLAFDSYRDDIGGETGSDGFYSKYGHWHRLNDCSKTPDFAQLLDPDNSTGKDGFLGVSIQFGGDMYVAPIWDESKHVCPPPLDE